MNFSQELEECGFFEGYTLQRFVIITAFSMVSIFGILANMLLMAVFWRTLPSSVYLACLSSMDMLICLTYLLLFGVDAGFVYLRNKTLFFLYHRYIVPIFFIAKTVQFAIPFLLILITLERYVWTTKEKTRLVFAPVFNDKGRCITVSILVGLSIIIRLPVLLATEVKQFPNCNDYFRSESVSPAEWASHSHAYYVFDLHVITAVQTCLPFFVLLILNLIIVHRLVKYVTLKPRLSGVAVNKNLLDAQGTFTENYVLLEMAGELMRETLMKRLQKHIRQIISHVTGASNAVLAVPVFRSFLNLAYHRSTRDNRSQLRNAIYTMLAIVMSYLVCNGVHLFLTFLERTDNVFSLLYDSEDPNQSSNFYIALSDTVSICYMVSSAIRILIYAKCNTKLRHEIRNFLRNQRN
uniref:G_PROTEIN_RECEP_F1_2 domain-containing protein n=1 Tax=Angiostrongylus cantonensis TaxID=6313 RepID=A0A158P6P5_ANGCA